ncbi:TonB-dependent receptor [Novosphingobium sp.]|uniref:TonB-dependent receptor n=1 Tax=Novosphingobium sp. TaxID=1874826 RepID=UPI0038B9FD91
MTTTHKFRRILLVGSAIGLAAGLGSEVAVAADAPQDTGLDEIVVTAQKREQNLQKVPATVVALSSEALQTRQIQDITGLQAEVPSLVVGNFYGTSLLTLRGISTGLTSGAEDPSVATHINGVYQPRSRSVDSAMADLERVEVLSGPQGTLYGRNATGGVVNYVLKRPSDTLSGEATARIGNYTHYGIQARVTGPLADNVRVLVSGIYDNQEKGYAVNLQPNAPRSRLDSGKFAGGRVALDVGSTSGVNAQFDAIYLDTRTVPIAETFGPADTPALTAFLGDQSFVPHKSYTQIPAATHSKYFQGSATINVPIADNVNLKSITGYQTFKDKMNIDLDASGVSSVETAQNIDSKTFTQEFDLSTETIGDRLKSLFGLFYFHDDFTETSQTPFSVPGYAAVFDTYTKIKAKSFAAFTDQTFSVTDKFRLQFGLRYNHDEKEAAQSLLVGGAAACPLMTNKRSWDAWTPKVGAQYDIDDNAMLYGQWSKGFKAGGFTANSCYNGFDPESIQGPEAGIKTKLLDNRLRLNVSGYYYKINNLQVQKVVDVGTFFTLNAATAEIYGAEFSMNALLTPELQFDASGMVQSAKYKNFLNCNETAFQGACGSFDPRSADARLTDVSGNWLNRAAPYSLNLGLQYTFDLGGAGKLLLRGESYFSGKVHFSEFPSAQSTQKAYSLQNAFITFTSSNEKFVLRGYVKNIGNVDYKRSYFFNSAIREGTGNYGPPRTFGVDATVRF